MKEPKRAAELQAVARLRRECEILSALNHPNILVLLDSWLDRDEPWLVTEYIQYGSLHDHVRSYRNDIERGVRFVRDLAIALQYAHERGFVHRDIKPKNIFLRSLDSAVIGDWGIAHNEGDTSITISGEIVGSRDFAPPEALLGHIQPEPSFDVFSLGRLLHYMIAGGLSGKQLDHGANPIKTHSDRFNDLAGNFLEKACAKESGARFQTMGEVVDALDRLSLRTREHECRPSSAIMNQQSTAEGAVRGAELLLLNDILLSFPSVYSYITSRHRELGLQKNAMGLLLAMLKKRGFIASFSNDEYGTASEEYWCVTDAGKAFLSTQLDHTSIYLSESSL